MDCEDVGSSVCARLAGGGVPGGEFGWKSNSSIGGPPGDDGGPSSRRLGLPKKRSSCGGLSMSICGGLRDLFAGARGSPTLR